MNKAKAVFVFQNGNVAVTDEKGQQMTKYQGSLYNYKYAEKLAKVIVKDNLKVEEQQSFPPLRDYISFYKQHPELLEEAEEKGGRRR